MGLSNISGFPTFQVFQHLKQEYSDSSVFFSSLSNFHNGVSEEV